MATDESTAVQDLARSSSSNTTTPTSSNTGSLLSRQKSDLLDSPDHSMSSATLSNAAGVASQRPAPGKISSNPSTPDSKNRSSTNDSILPKRNNSISSRGNGLSKSVQVDQQQQQQQSQSQQQQYDTLYSRIPSQTNKSDSAAIDPDLDRNGFLLDKSGTVKNDDNVVRAALTNDNDHNNVQYSQLAQHRAANNHLHSHQPLSNNAAAGSAATSAQSFPDPSFYNTHTSDTQAVAAAAASVAHSKGSMAMPISQDNAATSTPVHYPGMMGGATDGYLENSPRAGDYSNQTDASSMMIDSKDLSTSGTSRKRKAGALNEFTSEELSLPLEDLVERVRDTGGSSSVAEKNKQLFGFAWLQRYCQLAPDANVPRNRIYARYVSMCSGYNLRPLNPASFGKLVRTKFPQIRTRRLGIRGQSKYHYCGISLVDELSQPNGDTPVGTPSRYSAETPDSFVSLRPHLIPSNSVDYSAISSYGATNGMGNNGSTGDESNRLATPSSGKLDFIRDIALFDGMNDPISSNDDKEFSIPPLDDYLPTDVKVNPDDAATLFALYRSYCQSLLEYFRFMQITKLYKTIQTFIGGLTTPVQRLLGQPSVSNWVAKIDWMLYKEMVQLLNKLVFDEIPGKVTQYLRGLAQSLPTKITESLVSNNMPDHLIESKLVSAKAFVSVLDRMLRANDASIHAGRILGDVNEVEKMKKDWIEYVNGPAIAEREVPCEESRVTKILNEEIPSLLSVLPVGAHRVSTKLPAASNGKTSDSLLEQEFIQFKGDDEEETNEKSDHGDRASTEGKAQGISDIGVRSLDMYASELLRWADYLSQLPGHFPEIPPRIFLLCVSTVLTCALRDISVNGGEGFGAWWVVRMWIDEWLGWRAEMGGFLARSESNNSLVSNEELSGNVDLFIHGADVLKFRYHFPIVNNARAKKETPTPQIEGAAESNADN